MKTTPMPRSDRARPPMTTETLATYLGIKPQTLRAALCRDGHYFGIRPQKAPNRFLLWPENAVERLLSGAVR